MASMATEPPPLVVSDDDSPIVADFQPEKLPKRPRSAAATRPVKPPKPVSAAIHELCAPSYASVDAVKAALQNVNESCKVRLRSTNGKFVRFGCKFGGCPLNVSGKRIGDGAEQTCDLAEATFVYGTCGRISCASCFETVCNVVTCFRCAQGHHLCDVCFSDMVSTQVRGGTCRARTCSARTPLFLTDFTGAWENEGVVCYKRVADRLHCLQNG